MKVIHDGQGVVVGIEEFILDSFPNLKVIGATTTGLDHLPLEEIKQKGIKLISLRDFSYHMKYITSTSEHTFGLILALLRNYKTALSGPYKDREEYKGHTLSGKTLGIIGGNGRIGRQMKNIAKGFSMTVLTHDISSNSLFDKNELKNLLKESDIISVHIPLENNEEFFTKEMFNLMKSSAQFINTSRNRILQKGALLYALENNIIAGAGMDFIDDQALVEYAKTHDNLILTNHIGGMTYEDRESTDKLIIKAVENLINDNK